MVGIFALSCIGSPAHGQSRSQDIALEDFEESLRELSQDKTEEYLEILEDLQDLLDDYADYLADLKEEEPDHEFPSFDRLREKLDEGDYLGNPEKLLGDIDTVIDEIKEVEGRHRAKYNVNNPQCCRLPRSLRKELVMTYEIIEDHIDRYGPSTLNQQQIQEYLDATRKFLADSRNMDELKKVLEENRQLLQTLESIKALNLDKLKELEGIGGRYFVFPAPEVPDVPEVPEIPEIPAPKTYKPYKNVKNDKGGSSGYSYQIVNGKAGAEHQTVGTILVTDPSRRVVIDSHTGEVIIEGGNVDQITAKYWFEVSSTSQEKEDEFIDRTTLMVSDDGREYHVEVALPRLTDFKTDLRQSVLRVEVPIDNPVFCKNSFGEVTADRLQGGIEIEAENSPITLTDIEGRVVIEGRMGSINLNDVRGKIGISNANGPIVLSDCEGDFKLVNEYGQIELNNCSGPVEIDSRGAISVTDHEGNVFAASPFGRMELEGIRGDLDISGGYEPMIVSEIEGTVKLENTYGEISVENVIGRLSVANNTGPIYIEDLDGPVDVYNKNSTTSVVLTPGFKGGSQITSVNGTVKIAFFEQPDLTLALSCEEGSIASTIPISVKKRDQIKTAELMLGEGGDRLEVTTTGSSIFIQGR